MTLKWSLPERQALDGQLPHDLPAEIYLKIFDFLPRDDLKTLISLVRTCHFFRSFAVKCIYQCLHIKQNVYQSPPDLWSRAAYELGQALHSNAEGSQHLSEIPAQVIFEDNRPTSFWRNIACADQFSSIGRAFARMPNLRSISLQKIYVDACLLRLICSVPITSLALEFIEFSDDVTTEVIASLAPSRLHLESLTVGFIKSSGIGDGPRTHAKTRLLFNSILDLGGLKALKLHCNADILEGILAQLLDSTNTLLIERFESRWLTNVPMCLEFLNRCPRLEHLLILSVSSWAFTEAPILSNSRLQSLHCPHRLIPFILPQERLLDLNVRLCGAPNNALLSGVERVVSNWDSICTLGISIEEYLAIPQISKSANLRDLTFYHCTHLRGDKTLSELLSMLTPSLSVRYLEFATWSGENLEGMRVLHSALTAFPNLEEIVTPRSTLRWVKQCNGSWEWM